MKNKIERPWGHRRKGGYVIRTSQLVDSLKKGNAAQFEKITVGTKPLVQLLRLLPGEYCQISANGRLEIALNDGAWLKPYMRANLVVIKPRKF